MAEQDTPPPTITAMKIHIIKKGEYDIWSMRIRQYICHTDHNLWDIIVNGDLQEEAAPAGEQPGPPALKTAKRNQERVKSILLLAIPDEYLLKFHNVPDAKSLWGCNQIKFENFTTAPNESLDKAYDRFQKLISQLEVHAAPVSKEDINQKFLRSLPPSWSQIALIMRNKPDIDQIDIDDLYNNLRVYEDEMKRSSSSTSNSQNLAFLSSENTSSTNEVSTASGDFGVSTAGGTSSSSQQIDKDDLEELDLRWQVAMLTVKVKKFIQKIGRNLDFKEKRPVSFDKSKVECYNCHKKGHFARECNSGRNQGKLSYGDNGRRNTPTNKSSSQALVAQNGLGGYDWSNDFEGYKLALESLESRILGHEKNELAWGYGTQLDEMSNKSETDSEISLSVFEVRSSDEENTPANDRFSKAYGYHVVPPPITGNFLILRADISFTGLDEFAIRKKIIESKTTELNIETSKTVGKTNEVNVEKPKSVYESVVPKPTINRDRVIIKDWNSDDENDVSELQTTSHVKINKTQIVKTRVDKIGTKSIVILVKVRMDTDLKKSRWVWRPKGNYLDHVSKDSGSFMLKKVEAIRDLFTELHEELKFNLSTVSPNCRQENSVLFLLSLNALSCLLALSFLRKVKFNLELPRKEYVRLGHVNFKNINKLVKGHLVRGLPSKVFVNDHTCVACKKGKQHKASCKAKLERIIRKPLELLHMDLFRPVSVESINKKRYCLVVTDDFSRFSWVFFLATKDETSEILCNLIIGLENQLNHNVKIIRCDNGTEFKNHAMNEFCAKKGIKKEFSVARTPQQNGVGRRKTGTLIALELCNSPSISFMRPFGCPLTILNTLDSLGKFDGKSDEGYLLGYSTSSKAFRVYNKRTKRVEENLHINFLEDQPNVTGTGPNWMFDLDFLTNLMNYIPVSIENQVNVDAGTQDSYVAGSSGKDKGPTQEYILLLLQPHRIRIPVEDVAPAAHEKPSESSPKDNDVQDSEDVADKEGQHQMTEDEQVLHDDLENMIAQEVIAKALDDATRQAFEEEKRNIASQKRAAQATSTNKLSTVRSSVSTATTPYVSAASTPTGANAGESSFVYLGGKIPIDASTLPNADLPIDLNMPDLKDDSDAFSSDGIFNGAYDDENVGAVADFNNMDDTINVSPIPTLRIHKNHPKDQILGDPKSAVQTRGKIQKASSAQQALKSMCIEFEDCMHKRFQMSSMGELTFFLGLQVKQQPDGLFISQDKDSPFELEAFSDGDYRGANLDRKSTTEYVAAANYCGQVLWIQNQMMDYGFNFMNTKIHIDNESTISVIKNPVAHSRTKHIEIRFHFIRDCYEKRLIEVIKIHTDHNVADLLTKGFDVTRFNFLVLLEKDIDGTEELLLPDLFILLLTKVSTNSAKLVPLGKDSTAIKPLEKIPPEGQKYITAKVAGKPVNISEASIRSDLLFDDVDGIDSLPNQAIFDAIQLMGTDQHETQPDLSPRPLSTIPIPDSILDGSGGNHGDLKSQIKQLKKKAKLLITHHKAWMKSISMKQRLVGKESLKKKWMQKEFISKQGRKPAKSEPTVHKDPAFDDLDDIVDDAIDYMETEDA
ncbi:putative ribonuclease H-like domain-containing protein [Tanacetum coccineum]